MSLESPSEACLASASARRLRWYALPLAVWRLMRVLLHVLNAYQRSYWAWPQMNERQRAAETLRWSQKLLHILGVQLQASGQARPGAKLVVSNHVSWLDIVAINAVVPARFVSKAEVGQWPLVGRLVKGAGTLFLTRERRRDAMRVVGLMTEGLGDGQTVAVFPEGTTGSGKGVMHFYPNLLQSAIDVNVPVQPVALRYADLQSPVSAWPAYVGDITLVRSLWQVVSATGLVAHVHVLAPQATTHMDRRALAARLQEEIAHAIAV